MNKLNREKSPYLLQHKDNPVDWYPWCPEAFLRAEREDRPVFVSIGYSTCHWCHVMAHESFEDPEVAELLNAGFVCIKVDREERPDVDAVYMAACQAMTGSGGWPLTVCMDAKQVPFFAGTYFPKRSRYGQWGLMELLEQVLQLWRTDRERLLASGRKVAEALNPPQEAGGAPEKEQLQEAYRWLRRSFDSKWGGFGTSPKFPTPHNLLFLMQFYRLEQKQKALDMAESTLDAMARGGIQDQIGGGFSRYSTDESWLIPHFEKMLYDNALLILAYLEAYQLTRRARYEDTARRTADYVLEELTDPEGGFYCGQDADSDGVEGKYYVFTQSEVLDLLGRQDGAAFCKLYGISQAGNFGGKSVPNRIGRKEEPWSRDDPRLQRLRSYRRQRARLHTDDKILLSWNSWMILALARAGRVLSESRYLEAARKAQRFIRTHMQRGGRLFLRYRDGEAAHGGQLEDYAGYALALLELYDATYRPAYLQEAVVWAEQMQALFEDPVHGGYYQTARDAEPLIARLKETYDGAMPSGNSVAAMVLVRLAKLTGESCWQRGADRQLRFLAGAMQFHPAGHCFGQLALALALYPGRQLICAGPAVPEELRAYSRTRPALGLDILYKSPENERILAQCAPFTESYPVPQQGTVWYLCENGACRAPVTDWKQLHLPEKF